MKKSTLILFVVLLTTLIVDASAQTENENPITLNFNLYSILGGSGAYDFNRNKFNGGFDIWVNARVDGNLGRNVSYFADIEFALLYAERESLGSWPVSVSNDPALTIPSTVVYSQPLAYFPYTYRSEWGGWVYPMERLGRASDWPDTVSGALNLLCEVSGSAFNDNFLWSIGRTGHEVAGMVEGSSLVMNKAAQPFFGFDIQVNFFPWLSLYSLSGILEFYSSRGIQESARTFQNGFTLTMLTAEIGRYVQIDAGTSTIWPKRFDPGYLFPLTFPFLYQNLIGDFDNVTLFGNIKLQYPGLGFLWFSLFVDETDFTVEDYFHLDRQMYAFQAGMQFTLPLFSSSSITLSYTKIEPYCYTHPKVRMPWYGQDMEESYVNHGYGLGYYLPPNSDEIKLVFAAEPAPPIAFDVQFQMIRHGADYGGSMVDGSSYVSEIMYSSVNLNTDSALRKYFLHDGAYQWMYIIKTGARWKLPTRLPISIFGDMGMVFSYFTNIEGQANTGVSSGYSIIDTTEYPKSTSFILTIGCRVSIF